MDPTKKNQPDDKIYIGGDVNYVPGAVQKPCAQCAAKVWISPSGQRYLALNPIRILCLKCAAVAAEEQKKTGEKQQIEACPGSLEEIQAYFRRN